MQGVATVGRTKEQIAERASRIALVNTAENKTRRAIAATLKEASRIAGDGTEIGGTPFTILKRRQPPIATLIEKNKIGGEEVRAVEEIEKAFFAISGGLMIKPLEMERVDRSHGGNEPSGTMDAVRRYQSWARHWSSIAKLRRNKTLQVIIAAVIDERPFSAIENDLHMRNGEASKMVARGLRHYAARAGWVDGRLAQLWITTAELI